MSTDPEHEPDLVWRLFDAAPGFLLLTETDGHIRAANPAAVHALRIPLEELRTLRMDDLIAPQDRPIYQSASKRALGATAPTMTAVRCLRRDGTTLRLDVSLRTVTDESGIPFLALEAQESQPPPAAVAGDDRYLRIVERSPEATVVVVEGRVELVNDAAIRLFRAPGRRHLISMSFDELLHEDSLPTLGRSVRTMSGDDGSSPVLEDRIRCLDGTVADVEAVAVPMPWKGRDAVHVILRDITARRQAEQALRTSERKFRSFVENVFDAVYQSTPDGDLLMVNPAMVEMLGYASEEELLTVNIARDLYADPQEREPLLREAERVNGRRNVELRLRRKDGRIITCLENTRVLRKKNGEVMHYEGTLKDITDWKRVQEELRQGEERYRAFVSHSTEGIWCYELDEPIPTNLPTDEQVRRLAAGAYLKECNEAMARMLGRKSPTEVLGRPMAELLDLREDRGLAILRAYVENDYRIENLELSAPEPGGATRTFLHNVVGIVEHGRLVRAWGTQQDITQRKLAEVRLRESEERYRDFFDDDLAGHFISQADGTLIACNAAFARLLGYSSVAEILRANASTFYPTPEDRDRFMARLRSKGRLETVELVLRRKNGQLIRVVENVRALFDDEGELVQIQGFIVDITEQRDLEQKLREAQKLEMLGTLAGGVAHDFNNLLTIIRGYTDLLGREGLLNEKGRSYLEPVETAVQRGAAIVRQLMTFAREERHEVLPIDVNKTVIEVLQLASVTFPEHVRIERKISSSLPGIMGDPTQVHQALLNLVLNARDAMPAGGLLEVSTSVVAGSKISDTFPGADAPSYVCVTVADEGEGMTEDTRRRIFEPFFSTKGVGRGSGLGLAVVYGVVRGHGGFVDVVSRPHEGSEFRLYFPASDAVAAPAESAEQPVDRRGNETILIVEDEPVLLELLRTLLESNGYKVLSATDGEEAVAVYRTRMSEIALVLSDMGLPKLGGWEVFQKMRELNPAVRSILASGYLDRNLRADLLAAGAKDFIQKPYVPERILRRIREVIDEAAP